MPLYEEQKKQLAKPGKRKARKASQSKLKRRNIQEDKPMFNTMRGVEQVKAKAPASKVKELGAERGVSGEGNGGQEKPSPDVSVDAYKTDLPAHRPKYSPQQIRYKKTLFLKAMERGIFSLGIAARAADVSRNTILAWQDQDSTFKARCDELFETALDQLEETIRQNCLSLSQPHRLTGLLALLNAYRKDRFAPMTRHEHSGPGGGPILQAVAAKIKGMDTEELRVELSKILGPAICEQPDKEGK